MFPWSRKPVLKTRTVDLDDKSPRYASDEQTTSRSTAGSSSAVDLPKQENKQENDEPARDDEGSHPPVPTMGSLSLPPIPSKNLPAIPDDAEFGLLPQDGPSSSTLPLVSKQTPIEYPTLRRGTTSSRSFLHDVADLVISEAETQIRPLVPLGPRQDPQVSTPSKPPLTSPSTTPNGQQTESPTSLSPPTQSTSTDPEDEERRRRRRRPQNSTFAMLQSIAESGANFSPPPYTPSTPASRFLPELSASASMSSHRSSSYGIDEDVAKKLEQRAKLRRLQSLQEINQKHGKSNSEITCPPVPVPPLPQPASLKPINHPRSQSEPVAPTAVAPPIPKKPIVSVLPHAPSSTNASVETPQEDSAPSEPTVQALRHQLDQALHELRDSREAIERLAIQHEKERDLRFQQRAEETTQLARSAQAEAGVQKRLDRALRELRDSREANEQQNTQHQQEKDRLMNLLKQRNDEAIRMTMDERKVTDRLAQVEAELKDTKIQVQALKKEKQTWQEQLETMHLKMVNAERRMRHLDNLTHAKLDARQDGAFGTTARSSKLATSKEMSSEVISAVVRFNEEVSQTAILLAEKLERIQTRPSPSLERTKQVLGKGVLALLEAQARERTSGIHLLLMQTVLEVFLVHWCSAIIDASYPRKQSFADVLVELSSGRTTSTSGSGSQLLCGKRVQIVQTQVKTPSFDNWTADVVRDLMGILQTGGVAMRSTNVSVFTSKVRALIQLAYDLRLAMAEKDICGVEAMSFTPDAVFISKYMANTHEATGRRNVMRRTAEAEYIAGTSALGLQRVNSTTRNAAPVVVLKPRVALMSALVKESA